MARHEAVTAETVARSLAAWFVELGYLQPADARQIIVDEFGDEFVWTRECGACGIRQDVLVALRTALPDAAWRQHVGSWGVEQPHEQS
jgi:hypothetical protein